MNKWRLLLFAVFCIFQPISSENLFNGRERCVHQRRDFYRKDSGLQSFTRPEIRQVDDRNNGEFIQRGHAEDGRRLSERYFSRDENIRAERRAEDRRLGSTDRIRDLTSRQREDARFDRRSSTDERSASEIRYVRDDKRLNTERERNDRFTRSLPREERKNERVETRGRRALAENWNRQARDVNERRESRRQTRDSQLRDDARANSEFIHRFIARDDIRRSNERLQRDFEGKAPENRRQNVRSESSIRNGRSATIRRDTEQRTIQNRESGESRDARRELRDSSDQSQERFVRLSGSQRQTNGRLYEAQRDSPATRRNNIRYESRYEKTNRRSSPVTRASQRQESVQRESDEPRQLRRELNRRTDEYSQIRAQRNVRPEFIRTFNADEERRNKLSLERYFRRETRASDRDLDDLSRRTSQRLSQTERNVRRDVRNSRVAARHSDDTMRKNSPKNERSDLTRHFRSQSDSDIRFGLEKLSQRINELSLNRRVRENIRSQSLPALDGRTERIYAAIARDTDKKSVSRQRDTLDASRNFRREIRNVRSDDESRRDNERLNARVERVSRLRDNLDESRKSRREIRAVSLDDSSRRDIERLNARVSQERSSRQRDNVNEYLNSRKEIRAVRLDDSSRRDSERLNGRDLRERSSRQRDNLHESTKSRREIRAISLDDSSRRDSERLNAQVLRQRASRQREGDEHRNSRQEIGAVRLDDSSRRDNERLDARQLRERHSRQRDVDEHRNTRRDIRDVRLDDSSRRDTERLNARVLRERASREKEVDEHRNSRREIRNVRFDDNSRRNDERFYFRLQRDERQNSRRDTHLRELNAELRRDLRQVDENRRTARDGTMRGSRKLEREVRESRYVRDNEMTKERSLERTISMLIRKPVDTEKAQTNRMFMEQRNFQGVRSVERRDEWKTSRANRYESRYTKNSFERNMKRDSDRRLRVANRIADREERDTRRNSISRDSRNSAESERDNKTLREEMRLTPSDESDFSFKWQHLLYLLQAAYLFGIFAKLSLTKEPFEKKTRLGSWTYPKLIKVD